MTEQLETIAEELRPKINELEARFDAATNEDQRRAIAKEGTDLIAQRLIKNMLETTVVPQVLAICGVEQFARAFASGGPVNASPSTIAGLGCEYVVPKRKSDPPA